MLVIMLQERSWVNIFINSFKIICYANLHHHTKKKTLVVVFAFDKYKSYMLGTKVIVHTDHDTIRCLFEGRSFEKLKDGIRQSLLYLGLLSMPILSEGVNSPQKKKFMHELVQQCEISHRLEKETKHYKDVEILSLIQV